MLSKKELKKLKKKQYQMQKGCIGKVKHMTEESVLIKRNKDFDKKMKYKTTRAYKCEFCGFWHGTSKQEDFY